MTTEQLKNELNAMKSKILIMRIILIITKYMMIGKFNLIIYMNMI